MTGPTDEQILEWRKSFVYGKCPTHLAALARDILDALVVERDRADKASSNLLVYTKRIMEQRNQLKSLQKANTQARTVDHARTRHVIERLWYSRRHWQNLLVDTHNQPMVELVKHYRAYPTMVQHVFLHHNDKQIEHYLAQGYERVT